ncbi:ComEA family DNA-binding protein [Blastococcus sp. TML/M2B]|uniref:ComEA family DNA-binding protein n=1 Tax=unclassified Blastococcus TaxID=2619396 RepID=UPI00190A06B6|nr:MULTISPECIES: ComEA family DNA-binding protein [unclassified Blastococcus]MBN1092070.1 ComEA family DNA-binding protein [Blastococcus sp. TML/M2B]MBN1097823.1 ComEA family DNA-binding protein [Blastococcus sp. TML/C7B]
MRQTSRRPDDADVIRARLRALLDDGFRGGWVPEEEDEEDRHEADRPARPPVASPDGPDRQVPSGLGRHRAPGPAVRWNPGRPGARALWIAGLLTGLLVVAGTWLDRPRVEPVPPVRAGSAATTAPVPAPEVGEVAGTAAPVVVAVVGLVGRPGLVTLPTGARVADAVEAAGGLLPGTDPAAVNLAALVSDGQQIAVGVPPAAGAPPASAGGAGAGLVDLNTATVQDLDALPGIGPVLAQRIVEHRSSQGPFRSVDQLDDVPGIGPAIAAELVELVTV